MSYEHDKTARYKYREREEGVVGWAYQVVQSFADLSNCEEYSSHKHRLNQTHDDSRRRIGTVLVIRRNWFLAYDLGEGEETYPKERNTNCDNVIRREVLFEEDASENGSEERVEEVEDHGCRVSEIFETNKEKSEAHHSHNATGQ